MIYIYTLICPETNRPRYVGKTKDVTMRLAAHIAKAKGFHTNNHCANWIRILLNKGLQPTLVIITELPDDGDWQSAEAKAIAEYRVAGHKLTNSTGGGDGFHDMPEEIIAKREATRKKTMSDPIRRAAFIQRMTESRNRPEVRQKQRDSLNARWSDPDKKRALLEGMRTPEAIANRSDAARRKHAEPEFAARHSARMAAIWNTPERREEAKHRSLTAWANPKLRKRRVRAIIAGTSTPEYKAKMSAIGREIGARPEVKAIKSAKSKAYAADPVRFKTRLDAMSSPETRAKMAASAKARFAKPGSKDYLSTPEAKARASASARLRATPEYRAQLSARMKARWEKRRQAKQ